MAKNRPEQGVLLDLKAEPQPGPDRAAKPPAKAKRQRPSTAVAVRQPTTATAIAGDTMSENAQLMVMLRDMARDPKTNPARMRELMAIHREIVAEQRKAEFDEALAEMKPLLPVIDKKGRIEIRAKDEQTKERTGKLQQSTRYAKWEDIDEAITPILAQFHFSLTFRTETAPDGKLRVYGILSRRGHSRETYLDLPYDVGGSKNNVQAVGSSNSYGKRYCAINLLNIRVRGEDDDGRAGGTPMVSEEQIKHIVDALKFKDMSEELFLKAMSRHAGHTIDKVASIPALAFDFAAKSLAAYDPNAKKDKADAR